MASGVFRQGAALICSYGPAGATPGPASQLRGKRPPTTTRSTISSKKPARGLTQRDLSLQLHQLPEARHPTCAPAHFPAASRSDQGQRRPRLRSANEPLPQHIGRLSRSAQSKPLQARALGSSRHAQLPALELGGREGCLMTLTARRQRPESQATGAGARWTSPAGPVCPSGDVCGTG